MFFLKDILSFFLFYALFSYVVSIATENLPSSWDATGWGMLAVIVLFIGFVIGGFKVGAAYWNLREKQDQEPIWKVYSRPVISFKYGLLSLAICFGLLYLVIWGWDMVFH